MRWSYGYPIEYISWAAHKINWRTFVKIEGIAFLPVIDFRWIGRENLQNHQLLIQVISSIGRFFICVQ